MPETDDWGEPQIGGNTHDLQEEGPLVGTYLGFKEVDGNFGLSQLHSFDTEEGRKSVWGKAHLNRLLEGRQGELVKIGMTGNTVALGGGRSMVEYVLYSKGRQAAPPLPAQPLNAPEPPPFKGPEGDAEARQLRARRVAIACKDAQLDDEGRGDLIEYYTFGETRSAHDLDEKQSDEVWKLAQGIRRGKYDLRYDEKGKLYLESGGKALR